MKTWFRNGGALVAALAGIGMVAASWTTPTKTRTVDFNRDVRPILSNHCYKCHGPDAETVAAGLRLDTYEGATEDREGRFGIVPNNLKKSIVWGRVSHPVEQMRMPPKNGGVKPLTPEQIETLKLWIEQGAEYKAHWAFVPPKMSPLPAVKDAKWARNDVDRFVLARLEEEGLKPEPEADKTPLIRRAYLTLIGLPPNPEETKAFLADNSPDAYEKVVDRLLASSAYGEHQARYWLDAVRYGDTHGLHLDNERLVWPYRDWVVRALNEDLPFDKFTEWQLGGDLLPNPTTAQKVATGYIRMNPTTAEGGAIEAEFQAKNTFDRVDTTSTVFLGLTVACARCHDHKYDPISQREYYEMYAYFNSTKDKPLDDNALLPGPAAKAPTPDQEAELKALNSKLAGLQDSVRWEEATGWLATNKVDPLQISAWEISEIYSGKDFESLYTEAFAPEKSEETSWKPVNLEFGKPLTGILPGDLQAVYLRAKVTTAKAKTVQVSTSADDGARVWVNGKLVHDDKGFRGFTSFATSNVELQAGENSILVKVVENLGGDGVNLKFGDELGELIAKTAQVAAKKELTNADRRLVQDLYLMRGPDTLASAVYRANIIARNELDAKIPMTLVAEELEKPRPAHILKRGEYSLPADQVKRDVIEALGKFPTPTSRLGFARWLTNPQHPLTSRVFVNRVWQQHFGTGIVKTSEDFGNQGEWPSHPQLLDYLAVKFIQDGWSIKKLHRLIVTSAAFRQSAVISKQKMAVDPENRLISRGPRFRLDAEVIRDQTLYASGMLVDDAGGKGFKPYQPTGLWEEIAYPTSNTAKYTQDNGDTIYRRSIYLFWKRTSPHPAMLAFDAPMRESCTVRRPRTNTPLQALVTLNEPMFREAARTLAERVMKAEATPQDRMEKLFELTVARPVRPEEAKLLLNAVERYRTTYANDPKGTEGILKAGQTTADASLPQAELAAWTLIAQTLMNSDEFLTQH